MEMYISFPLRLAYLSTLSIDYKERMALLLFVMFSPVGFVF